MKVSALRITPTGRGNLSIDGEMYPFEALELRVHSGILRFLSLHGRYIADDFDYDRAQKKARQQPQHQQAATTT
jgi:sphingosine kinase